MTRPSMPETPQKSFQRRQEDFSCGRCHREVGGNGYTNHCPSCLWSRHVDVTPGDRRATCGGFMQPIQVEQKHGRWVITHRCELCGLLHRNRTTTDDDFTTLTELASKPIP